MAADVLTSAARHSPVAASAAVNGRAWWPVAGPPRILETFRRRGLEIFRIYRGVTLRVSCGPTVVAAAAPGSGKGFGAGGGGGVGGGRPKSGGSKKRGVKGPRPEGGDDASVARILRRLDEIERTTEEPPPASGQSAASVKDGADRGETKGELKLAAMSRLGIEPRAAARGRVDYAEVEGWEPYMAASAAAMAGGSTSAVTTAADAEDIGNLRLRRFAPGATAASLKSAAQEKKGVGSGAHAEEEGGRAAAAGATQPVGLYEQLVRHLQQAESRGELAVARPKSAPPLPPFERWRFGDRRYLQYLVDLHSVHSAVEAGLNVGGSRGSSAGVAEEGWEPPDKAAASAAVPDAAAAAAAASGDGNGGGGGGAAAALDLFGLELGIYRSAALMSDMTALRAAIEATDADAAADLPSKPTTQTLAFSNYIASLVRTIRSSTCGGSSGSSSSSSSRSTTTGSSEGSNVMSAAATLPLRSSKPTPQASVLSEGEAARLRLLANLFTVYVAHFTTGMRIGAKAVECVPALRRAAAVSVFRDYPAKVKDPLKDFVAAVNAAGEVLREEEVEVVLRELPKAMVRTSMLLSVISVEEKVVENGIVAEVL